MSEEKPHSLPDHAVRKSKWYQLTHRLPRALVLWFGAFGFLWAIGLCDIVGMPLTEGIRLTVGGLALTPFGFKVVESIKGIS